MFEFIRKLSIEIKRISLAIENVNIIEKILIDDLSSIIKWNIK